MKALIVCVVLFIMFIIAGITTSTRLDNQAASYAQFKEKERIKEEKHKEAYGKCLLSLKYEDYECYLQFKQ